VVDATATNTKRAVNQRRRKTRPIQKKRMKVTGKISTLKRVMLQISGEMSGRGNKWSRRKR